MRRARPLPDAPRPWWAAVRDWIVGIVSLLIAYAIYQLALVPWLEPVHARTGARAARTAADATPLLPAEIAALFPEGSWERRSPRLLATPGAMVLFQSNQSQDDGRMVIRPCTLVLRSRRERPVIIRAPEGAILRFDRPPQLTQVQPARFLGGQLTGEVTIERPESRPGAGDRFWAQTRAVQLSPTRIWTSQPVQFQMGRHYGSGRELILSLTGAPSSDSSMALGKPSELELVHLDQIVLEIPPPKETTPRESPPEPSTLRLTCDGSFLFDFGAQTAVLQRTVRGVHVTATGVIDRMTAQKLEIGFLKRSAVTADSEEAARENALLLHHVRLEGTPARVDAPSQQLQAEAATIDVGYFEYRIRLEDSSQARLRFQEHAISAATIDYAMVPGEPRRLGRFTASGPGEYRRQLPDQVWTIRWNGPLTLQPYGPEHVLSLPQGASVTLGRDSTFRAEEIYLWLEEVPEAFVSPSGDGTATHMALSGSQSEENNERRYRVRLRRLRAQRGVAFVFRGLQGSTKLLESWFEEEEADPSRDEPGDAGTGSASSGSTPVTGPSLLSASTADARQYQVAAETIRLQCVRRGKDWHIAQGQLVGDVHMRENPGGSLDGDSVELLRNDAGLARLEVVGRPAVVVQNGMTLRGATIHLDQSIRRMWMDGAGEMQMAAKSRDLAGAALPVTMRWKGGMDFDGKKVVFQRDVVIAGQRVDEGGVRVSDFRVTGSSMEATVDPPIDFQRPPQHSQARLQKVFFPGPVTMNHEVRSADGALHSRDALHVQDLVIDYPSGDFESRHPGWGESIRRGNTLPNAPVPPGTRPPKPGELIYLRVDFEEAMTGNYRQRQVRFRDRVRAIVGPVASWEERLDPTRPDLLGPQAFLLHCRELIVLQVARVEPPTVELHANGDVRVDGQRFAATGQRLVYDQYKDVLLLQGEGRVPARIRFRQAADGPASQVAAGAIRYSPRSGQLLSTDIQGGQFVAPGK